MELLVGHSRSTDRQRRRALILELTLPAALAIVETQAMEDTGSALPAEMPFASQLGIELLAARRDEVRGRLTWKSELCTTAGVLHGGAIMTLGDTLGALCAFLSK